MVVLSFEMNSRGENMSVIKKNVYLLRLLAEGENTKTTKYIIHGADKSLLHCFVDCAHNILEWNILL